MNLRILLIAALLSNALWARAFSAPDEAAPTRRTVVATCCCNPGASNPGAPGSACAAMGCGCTVAPAEQPRPTPPAPAPRAPDTLAAILPRDLGALVPVPTLDPAPRRPRLVGDRRLPSHNETQALLGVWRT